MSTGQKATIALAFEKIEAADGRFVSIPACPLMHGTGLWLGAMIPLLGGGAVVTFEGRSLDGDELWAAVGREGVTQMAIVGDAFARPLLRSLDAARDAGRPHDTASMSRLISSGAMLSATHTVASSEAPTANTAVTNTEPATSCNVAFS